HLSSLFNDTPTPEIYTLSLHDALPICITTSATRSTTTPSRASRSSSTARTRRSNRMSLIVLAKTLDGFVLIGDTFGTPLVVSGEDRKSTRLNSSHVEISYAVFCLKKKK